MDRCAHVLLGAVLVLLLYISPIDARYTHRSSFSTSTTSPSSPPLLEQGRVDCTPAGPPSKDCCFNGVFNDSVCVCDDQFSGPTCLNLNVTSVVTLNNRVRVSHMKLPVMNI